VGQGVKLYGPPLVDDAHEFYLVQYQKGEYLAIAASAIHAGRGFDPAHFAVSDDPGKTVPSFDHYLVSVEGAKLVVNTSRLITGTQVVPAPTATR
jgi:hypothetical protein